MRDFTLIELMIIMAIAGILAAIAVPVYKKYMAEQAANEQTTGIETEEIGGLQ